MISDQWALPDWLFSPSGMFYVAPKLSTRPLEQLFRVRVLKRLPSKKWWDLIDPSSPFGLCRDSRKVWEVDPFECPRCGRERKMISLIDDGEVIEKSLRTGLT